MRKAAGYMNYTGEVELEIGEVRGPTYMLEMIHVVSKDYDPETNITRVGWAFGLPDLEETAKFYAENSSALRAMQ